MRGNIKKITGIFLSSMMLPWGVIDVSAAEIDNEYSAEAEEVKIGSDIWETPVIPNAAVKIPGVQETEISLNEISGDGTWKFLYEIPDYTEEGGVPYPTEKNQDFDFSRWKDKNWENIIVPGEALMQGFDIQTNNEYYYQREITIPEDFEGMQTLVRFDGVYSNARVWIDGKYIKTHIGGFTTWDCDITEYVRPGQTVTLTVGVTDIYSDTKGIWNPQGEMLNNPSNATEYAHHNIGGILRDVSLVALPENYIARTYVHTELDENYANADLEITAQLGMQASEAVLKVELLDGEEVVVSGDMNFQKEENMSQPLKLTLGVAEPEKWDAEHPNLYQLRTTLYVDGEIVQVNEENIGFREIQYNGADGTDWNKVYVNGKEVKLRGTCRHDVSDDLGRSMTREEAYQEAEAYKNANINFIRTSHYPASEHLLDACDELGIYVEQETAVCFQGYGTFGSDVYSRYEDYLPQFTEMIERDRNRPSILIWSLGNESNYSNIANQSGGNAIQTERDYLEDVDRSRPCIFSWPDTGEPWELADIYSKHYADVQGNMGSSSKPILHDEYAHIACYNLDELKRDTNVRNFWGESVKKAWENIFTSDGALGGALWGGIDDVFYIPEGTSERWQSHSDGPTAGYGEWGSVLDAYLREKPEAYLTKKAYSPVRVNEDECYMEGEQLKIPVKNWFDHTNLNELEMEYTVDGETYTARIAENIEPHSEGVISVPGISKNAEKVGIKFYTADSVMVDEYEILLSEVSCSFTPATELPPELEETDKAYMISGEDFRVVFSKETGMISEAFLNGEEESLISGGPYLHVTGTDLGVWIPDPDQGLSAEIVDNFAEVKMKGRYENGQAAEFYVKISGNGIITAEYVLTNDPPVGWGLKEVGISYDIASSMESVSWQRDGLYSVYPEDHIGRNQGTAQKVREGAKENPDAYGKEPDWSWKDDMSNYFVYSQGDSDSKLATNDFRAMRENIYYYRVNYGSGEEGPGISVESEVADLAARVNLSYDRDYVDDRDETVKYQGSWETYENGSDYAGTETYSTQKGSSCEFTFHGTGIRYIGSKQKNTGKVKVYLDGEFQKEIDTYSDLGNELKQTVIYSTEGLENTEHTIRLETSGGKADCIVVDAFEILHENAGDSAVGAQLIINNQWYYPNLAWGNYTGWEGRLYNGSEGTAVIRLAGENHFSMHTTPVFENVQLTETGKNSWKVTYDVYKIPEDAAIEYQWYQVKEGDPKSKAEPVQGAIGDIIDADGMEASSIYCRISVKKDGVEIGNAETDEVEIGADTYTYHDVVADSEEFVFAGTEGVDYQTDRNEFWTETAYEKTVTYLMDTDTPELGEVSFTFNGTGIRWIGARENNQGIALVEVDGEPKEEIDLYAKNVTSGTQVGEILYEQTWEEPGEHTITIRRTGKKNTDSSGTGANVDAFIVLNQENETVESADTGALEMAVDMGLRLQEEQEKYAVYTEETWEAVQTALENAGNLLNNPEATQEEIDASFLELMTAINLLESDVQKAGLGAAIEGAKAILADASALADYTPESVEAVRSALAEAEAVYADTEATQTAINQAATNLMTAVNNLLVTETDNRLDILIQKAEELLQKEDQYTSDSVQALKDALEAAKEAAAKKDATEQEINDAYNVLAEAMASLVRVANKAELENALNKANEILTNAGKYTDSSLEGLQEGKDAAQGVYDNDNASREEIEEALKALINEILEVRLLGDVNLDEAVDSADAQALLRYNAELDELSEEQLDAADVNRDEAADSSDAGRILQYAAEMIEAF